jgi:hypothetical protein
MNDLTNTIPDFFFESQYYLENPLQYNYKEIEDSKKIINKELVLINKELVFKNRKEYYDYINDLLISQGLIGENIAPIVCFINCKLTIRNTIGFTIFSKTKIIPEIHFLNCEIDLRTE